jgi:hypothetical protein
MSPSSLIKKILKSKKIFVNNFNDKDKKTEKKEKIQKIKKEIVI